MKILKYLSFTIFLFIIGSSCSRKESSKEYGQYYADLAVSEDAMTSSDESLPSSPISLDETTVSQDKKIIKNGRLGIRVKELNDAKLRVDTLVAKYKGYYANENLINSDYESAFNLNIRIPALYFEKFISELEAGKGEVLYKSIDAQDVTTQYIDLETRLENKRSYLARYKEILKQAKTIAEILEIEEKIRYLQEEIESTEGQLKYLNDRVSLSSLNLNLSKEKDYTYTPQRQNNFTERFKQAVSNGWYELVSFFLFLIRIWPFWIIFAGIIFVFRCIRKRRRNRKLKQ